LPALAITGVVQSPRRIPGGWRTRAMLERASTACGSTIFRRRNSSGGAGPRIPADDPQPERRVVAGRRPERRPSTSGAGTARRCSRLPFEQPVPRDDGRRRGAPSGSATRGGLIRARSRMEKRRRWPPARGIFRPARIQHPSRATRAGKFWFAKAEDVSASSSTGRFFGHAADFHPACPNLLAAAADGRGPGLCAGARLFKHDGRETSWSAGGSRASEAVAVTAMLDDRGGALWIGTAAPRRLGANTASGVRTDRDLRIRGNRGWC